MYKTLSICQCLKITNSNCNRSQISSGKSRTWFMERDWKRICFNWRKMWVLYINISTGEQKRIILKIFWGEKQMGQFLIRGASACSGTAFTRESKMNWFLRWSTGLQKMLGNVCLKTEFCIGDSEVLIKFHFSTFSDEYISFCRKHLILAKSFLFSKRRLDRTIYYYIIILEHQC